MYYPTTTIDISRLNSTSEYGQDLGTLVSIHTNIPASIIDSGVSFQPPETGRSYENHSIVCRLSPDIEVLQGDRIKDNRTGLTYEVLTVTNIKTHVAHTNRLTLRQVDR